MVKKMKVLNLSFRMTYMMVSFLALCVASIISLGIVLVVINTFYNGPITEFLVVLMGLSFCVLSILIGGTILWRIAKWFSHPIEAIDKGVQAVAEGDFTATLDYTTPKAGIYEVRNELTTLVSNFNIMTAELSRMEYMSRDFMSNVSHEIKTPLATLTGITEILTEDGIALEEQQEYLEIINQTAQHIAALCESMLKLSKLEYLQIIERKDSIRLDEQIRHAVIQVSERYSDQHRTCVCKLEPLTIQCNASLLEQVWVNLLDNAFKYATEGSTINITLKKEAAAIKVSIHNEGEAIPKEKLARLFERFYQCDESHQTKGSGLGLAIVKRILALNDGSIECKSAPDQGVTMHISLMQYHNP